MTHPFDFSPCQQCACSAVRRASRAITHHFDKELRSSGLRVTQFTVLATLAQTGPMAMTGLSELLGVERTTLTRNLKALLRDEFVESRDDADGRVRRIAITPKGVRAAHNAFPLWKKAQDSSKKMTATLALQL